MKIYLGSKNIPLGFIQIDTNKLTLSNPVLKAFIKKVGLKNIVKKNPFYEISHYHSSPEKHTDPRNHFIVDSVIPS